MALVRAAVFHEYSLEVDSHLAVASPHDTLLGQDLLTCHDCRHVNRTMIIVKRIPP